jgi:hypothetical protein
METRIHDLLLRSFDDDLTSEEQRRLEVMLQSSAELRFEREQIRFLREMVSSETSQSFLPLFTERVMSRIRRDREKSIAFNFGEALSAAFCPVALGACILILLLLSFNAARNGGAVMAGVLDGSSVGVEEAFSPTYAWIEE